MKNIYILLIAIIAISCQKEKESINISKNDTIVVVKDSTVTKNVNTPTTFCITNKTFYNLDLYLYNNLAEKNPYMKIILRPYATGDTITTTDTILYVNYHVMYARPYITCHLKRNTFNLIEYIYP